MASTRQELAEELYDPDQNCVAKLRLRAGLSQTQLAKGAGITQPHLAKIESGRLAIQLSTAVNLADALGVSLDALRPLVQIQKQAAAKPTVTLL
jgi:transcriptional regulator with XRE-family HTH domain